MAWTEYFKNLNLFDAFNRATEFVREKVQAKPAVQQEMPQLDPQAVARKEAEKRSAREAAASALAAENAHLKNAFQQSAHELGLAGIVGAAIGMALVKTTQPIRHIKALKL